MRCGRRAARRRGHPSRMLERAGEWNVGARAAIRLAISRCTRCRRTTPARQKHCTSALLTAQVHTTAKAPHRRQTVGVDLDGIAE